MGEFYISFALGVLLERYESYPRTDLTSAVQRWDAFGATFAAVVTLIARAAAVVFLDESNQHR